jgi:hypothetical protein
MNVEVKMDVVALNESGDTVIVEEKTTTWGWFCIHVRNAFRPDAAERILIEARDPDTLGRDRNGWYHVRVPGFRRALDVGGFTGGLRVRVTP